jgi:hypothetical protein
VSRWLIDYCGFGRYRNHPANPRIASVDISSLLLEHVSDSIIAEQWSRFWPLRSATRFGNGAGISQSSASEHCGYAGSSSFSNDSVRFLVVTHSDEGAMPQMPGLRAGKSSSRIRGTKPSFTFATRMSSSFS